MSLLPPVLQVKSVTNSNMKDKRRLSNGSTKSLLEIETDVEVDLENYSSSKASKSSSRSRRR